MDVERQGNRGELQGNVQLLNTDSTGVVSQGSQHFKTTSQQTLDEPVIDTICRDLKNVAYKIQYVLIPRRIQEDHGKYLRNWDLWGPLLLCLLLALTLSIASSKSDTVFATIFVVIWVGAGVVTLNAKLLGGKISCFQSICVLGYCIFPINIAALVCVLLGNKVFLIRLLLVFLSFFWSTYSSVGFMQTLVSDEKRILAVYPVLLFYLFLAWYCLIVGQGA